MMNGLHVRKFNQFLKSTYSPIKWSKIKPNNYDKLRICIPIRYYSNTIINYPRKYNNNIGYVHYTSILFAQRQFCSSINTPNNPNNPKNTNNENTNNNNSNNNNINNNSNNNNHMSQNYSNNPNNNNNNNKNHNDNNNNGNNNNNNNNGHDHNAIPMIGALPANFPHMQKLFRKWQRKLTFTVLSIIISVVGLVYYFWDNNPYFNIRPYISSPLSQVATDAISTQDLQRQAVITSKNLLNDLFKDKTVRRDTSDFFITVLNDEILFENLIRILKSLITQDTIVSSFKELVLTVINDEKVFNELVNLISNAITHPKNKQLLVDTISEILENKTVRKNAAIMTSDTINEVLNDEQVKIIAIQWLKNVLKDETIQESTSNTLYKVVVGAITPKVFHKKKYDKTSTASPSSSTTIATTTTTTQEPLESFTETPKNEQEIIESGKEESNNKDIPLKYEHGNVHGEIIEIPKSKIHDNVDSESGDNIGGKEENENDDTSEESLIKKIDDQTSNF